MKRRIVHALIGALVALSLLSPEASAEPPRTLTVFAAASLTDAFKVLGRRFEATHPGVAVRFNFGASNVLALQIKEGAPADVFASAAMQPAEQLRAAGELLDSTTVFARNKLVVVVPRDNPANLRTWTDIAHGGVKLVLAAPGVPAGDYARVVLQRAGILEAALKNLVSNEPTVRAALSKVVLGEADAGVVYVSDARSRPGVRAIAIPDAANMIAEYPICATRASADAELAQAFVRFVKTPSSQSLLGSYGFIPAR